MGMEAGSCMLGGGMLGGWLMEDGEWMMTARETEACGPTPPGLCFTVGLDLHFHAPFKGRLRETISHSQTIVVVVCLFLFESMHDYIIALLYSTASPAPIPRSNGLLSITHVHPNDIGFNHSGLNLARRQHRTMHDQGAHKIECRGCPAVPLRQLTARIPCAIRGCS